MPKGGHPDDLARLADAVEKHLAEGLEPSTRIPFSKAALLPVGGAEGQSAGVGDDERTFGRLRIRLYYCVN